ncbi:uncharacterized protein LOC132933241 [Metopolophium dirhodum]|uniref:uncharacterized protein LOC132933241 n=1 Tax=Metopolophium dirhodum TaxID=44670 RepID=UPI00298F8CF9|nr:uncharacterized protein LOC132933241 [Metopolophium dirhodum]
MAQLNIDTELLISEVEARKNLWHAGDELYKDRDIRIKSWKEITSNIIKNYNEMSDFDQKKAVEKVQQRWKTARDAKMRSISKNKNMKSGSAAKNLKHYIYDRQLQFLETVAEPNTSQSSLDEIDVVQAEVEEDDQNTKIVEDQDDSIELPAETEKWKRKRNTGSTTGSKINKKALETGNVTPILINI